MAGSKEAGRAARPTGGSIPVVGVRTAQRRMPTPDPCSSTGGVAWLPLRHATRMSRISAQLRSSRTLDQRMSASRDAARESCLPANGPAPVVTPRCGDEPLTSASDHFLPFRSGHGYDRYRQERPVIGSRPRGSIARSKVIRCTLPRRDTGCCGTPFGSPIFQSLRDIFGKEQMGTDFGKTAPYRHRKGRSARFVPFDLPLRERQSGSG